MKLTEKIKDWFFKQKVLENFVCFALSNCDLILLNTWESTH